MENHMEVSYQEGPEESIFGENGKILLITYTMVMIIFVK
jgi:hypothetical protein